MHIRILDNLPLVVPIRWADTESPLVYELGFSVGLKGIYAGVSMASDIEICPLFRGVVMK